MAVLSEALLYCTSGVLLVQALSGWLSFIQLLAKWAPEVLQRVAAQAAVVLLPTLELTSSSSSGGAAAASAGQDDAVQLAAAVLHEMVVRQRASVKPALKNMPPLPSLDNLKEVNAVLAQVCWEHHFGVIKRPHASNLLSTRMCSNKMVVCII